MASMNNDPALIFITGGARSGKSRRAQALAEAAGQKNNMNLVYIATAEAFDEEMQDRIDRHRFDRGGHWRTVECPIDLPAAIARESSAGCIILVDCLTLWVSNMLLGGHDFELGSQALIDALAACQTCAVIVSNEVGLGIVPDNPLARRFRDMAGILNQRVANQATVVELIVAGIPMRLKPPMGIQTEPVFRNGS
jgi:adenosylcobinamide kinase / adenosylcobinamide-phosphate guanylyltransferase